MAKTNIKLSELPETTTDDGVKVYGATSYETQIAILSHYLHTFDGHQDLESRANRNEILSAIRDYIEYKRMYDKHNPFWKDVSEEEVAMAAERYLGDITKELTKSYIPERIAA